MGSALTRRLLPVGSRTTAEPSWTMPSTGRNTDRSKWIPASCEGGHGVLAARTGSSTVSYILGILEDQEPWCPEFNGPVRVHLQTGCSPGEFARGPHRRFSAQNAGSAGCSRRQRTFTPRYGCFEIRARCVLGATNVAAFRMIGFEDEPDRSAEICIVEVKGASARRPRPGSVGILHDHVRAPHDRHLRATWGHRAEAGDELAVLVELRVGVVGLHPVQCHPTITDESSTRRSATWT